MGGGGGGIGGAAASFAEVERLQSLARQKEGQAEVLRLRWVGIHGVTFVKGGEQSSF